MGIDPMNNISIIIRILFAVTIFQQIGLEFLIYPRLGGRASLRRGGGLHH
jgi:hypothetical protein